MKTVRQILAGALAAGGCLCARVACAVSRTGDDVGGLASGDGNFQPPVTRFTGELHRLHALMLILCALIFVGVFGVVVYSIFAHRRRKGRDAVHFHRSTFVELLWTATPFVIVVLMALPATRAVIAMKNSSAFDAYLTIRVTDYQRKWRYEYMKGPGAGIQFLSAPGAPENSASSPAANDQATNNPTNDPSASGKTPSGAREDADRPLVVPVGQKIRLIATAGDVAFSWYVPSFDIKQDVVSQFTHDMWFKARKTGVYHGFCAGQCERGRTYIPVVVWVLSAGDYAQWVDAQKKKMAAQTLAAPASGAQTP